MQTIGQRIRAHRLKWRRPSGEGRMGLSQRALAARAGISPSTLVHIETDQRTPHELTVQRIADALGVSVEQLQNGG